MILKPKQKVIITLFVTLVILNLLSPLKAVNNVPPARSERLELPESQAIAELQALRQTKGHFSGGKWNDDVDKRQGKKYQLMFYFQKRLSKKGTPQKEMIRLLGEPDRTVLPDYHEPNDRYIVDVTKIKLKQNESMAIYFWRSAHDFLYFIVRDDHIVKSNWWFALE